MVFNDLRSFLKYLEDRKQLVRVTAPVDPDQEITIIQHRVAKENGPALLFENVKGSKYKAVVNLFGTRERVHAVFGDDPGTVGEKIASFMSRIMRPSLSTIRKERVQILRLLRSRIKQVRTGPILDTVMSPVNLDMLPVLKCWPDDGGKFFTLPLVYTQDPETSIGNLGIYRLHKFDSQSTGMHWQIEKGGGFHFYKAASAGKNLDVSVILGGPPALIIAAVAPMPENIDERLLAAYIMGTPIDVIMRKQTGHKVPAKAEIILEGTVSASDTKMEGPFGDHFGHYSKAARFPVFRVKKMLARKDAIYPATVVGKPVQEDYYIGEAVQDLSVPVAKLMMPGISDIRAYPETGFHPLTVISVKERYPREALKHVFGILGQGQASLTKVLIAVDHKTDVHDFKSVSLSIWRYLKADDGIFIIAPTSQDTLDFTGPKTNTGSRLILVPIQDRPIRDQLPPPLPPKIEDCPEIEKVTSIGPAFLIARLKENISNIEKTALALREHPIAKKYLFHVLLSDDVPLDSQTMILWGWYTRFDPLQDLYPAKKTIQGNRLIFDFPITIDARWKPNYPKPVEFDPKIEQLVNKRWKEYKI